jgi:hypothetical protein
MLQGAHMTIAFEREPITISDPSPSTSRPENLIYSAGTNGQEHEPPTRTMTKELVDIFRIQTSIRYWQQQVKRRIEVYDWPILEQTDIILGLTVYEGVPDTRVAKRLGVSVGQVKSDRAEAVQTLLTTYRAVLENGEYDNDDVLCQLLTSIRFKVALFEDYTKTKASDVELGEPLEKYIRSGDVGRIINAYLDLRSGIYVQTGQVDEEFKPINELTAVTGYTRQHLGWLLSRGLVVGVNTEEGWYSSEVYIRKYQEGQQLTSKGGAPRSSKRQREQSLANI